MLELFERRFASLELPRLHHRSRQRVGGAGEERESGDQEERAHARKLAERIDPSIFPPTPTHGYRYLRMPATARPTRGAATAVVLASEDRQVLSGRGGGHAAVDLFIGVGCSGMLVRAGQQ